MSNASVDVQCRGCGSPTRGRVCHFCGMVTDRIESPEAEAEAIHELHVAISAAKDDEARARLLANGPLPDDRDVLIDTALRATQLLDPKNYNDQTPHAATRRVEAVCIKLKILASDDVVARRAVEQLEKKLADFQAGVKREHSEGGKAVFWFVTVGLLLLAAIAWGAWAIVR